MNTATNGKRFKQGGKQFSPTNYVKAQYLVSVSEGGSLPTGCPAQREGAVTAGPAAQTSPLGAGGKRVESQQSVVSYFQLMHSLLPRSAIRNAYLSCKMWN